MVESQIPCPLSKIITQLFYLVPTPLKNSQKGVIFPQFRGRKCNTKQTPSFFAQDPMEFYPSLLLDGNNPFEKYLSNWIISPSGCENFQHLWKHPLVFRLKKNDCPFPTLLSSRTTGMKSTCPLFAPPTYPRPGQVAIHSECLGSFSHSLHLFVAVAFVRWVKQTCLKTFQDLA